MSYLMLFLDGPHEGLFLLSYDPDFENGRGRVEATRDRALARRFETVVELWEEWKRPSTVHPIRLTDGKPNRPLSAFSITTEKA